MQLNNLQSEILDSVKNLQADQQLNVLEYITAMQQKNDQRVKERLKSRALREIRQALKKEVLV